jgi:hypothetical protein
VLQGWSWADRHPWTPSCLGASRAEVNPARSPSGFGAIRTSDRAVSKKKQNPTILILCDFYRIVAAEGYELERKGTFPGALPQGLQPEAEGHPGPSAKCSRSGFAGTIRCCAAHDSFLCWIPALLSLGPKPSLQSAGKAAPFSADQDCVDLEPAAASLQVSSWGVRPKAGGELTQDALWPDDFDVMILIGRVHPIARERRRCHARAI